MSKDTNPVVESWIGDPSMSMGHRIKIISAEMTFFWGLAFDLTSRWIPWDWEIRNRKGNVIAIGACQYNFSDEGPRVLEPGAPDIAANMIRFAEINNLVPLWVWRTPKHIYFKVLNSDRGPCMVGGTNRPEVLKP